MHVVSPSFVRSLAALFASAPAWAQVAPGQPASALFAAGAQAAQTVVLVAAADDSGLAVTVLKAAEALGAGEAGLEEAERLAGYRDISAETVDELED